MAVWILKVTRIDAPESVVCGFDDDSVGATRKLEMNKPGAPVPRRKSIGSIVLGMLLICLVFFVAMMFFVLKSTNFFQAIKPHFERNGRLV